MTTRLPRWSKKTDALVRHIAERTRPGMQSELGRWLEDIPRFSAFVAAHQDKIRKKLGAAVDEEARLDVRAELLVARLLLVDRRIELAFEAYGAGRRGPDLSVSYRVNQRFNVEVTRVRAAAEAESAEPSQGVARLANIVAGKLRQFPSDAANALVIANRGLGVTPEHLAAAARLLKTHSDAKDDAFFARRGPPTAREFYAQYVRLGGVFTLDEATTPPTATFWANRAARHPLADDAAAAVLRNLRSSY